MKHGYNNYFNSHFFTFLLPLCDACWLSKHACFLMPSLRMNVTKWSGRSKNRKRRSKIDEKLIEKRIDETEMKDGNADRFSYWTYPPPWLKKHSKLPQLNLAQHQPMTDRQIDRQIGILFIFLQVKLKTKYEYKTTKLCYIEMNPFK